MKYVTAGVLLGFMLVAGQGRAGADEGMTLIRVHTEEGENWFYIDRYEVTVAAFRAFDSEYKSYEAYFEDPNLPVTGTSFLKARAYCQAQGKRLPTSEEWQLACLGPEGLTYSYGNSWDPAKARMGRRIWTDGPKAVGSYEANGYEIYDMVGNVWEWVDDGEAEGERRSVYGGSWTNGPRQTRCSVGMKSAPDQPVLNYGFRCARSVTEADRARIAQEEEAKLQKVKAAAAREAARRRAAQEAVEAARKARVDAEAQKVRGAELAVQRAKEAEAARKAEAFARKIAHMVLVISTVAREFYMDRHEVTVEAFRAFDPSYRPSEFSAGDRMPATGVTFEQAAAYCRSIGKGLPTAEEWVSACMGEKGYLFSYGRRFDASRARTGLAWFAGADTVGVGAPSTYGATDMVGNVWEWVDGWYDDAQTLQLLQGGSWVNGAARAKCSGTMWARPGSSRADFGFRCAVDKE